MSGSSNLQVYVSFSGESSKVAQPIEKIYAIDVAADWSGTLLTTPVTGKLKEPRGLAVDDAGRLYVAQASKKDTAILVFPPAATYPLNGTVLVSESGPLLHPYGLAFDAFGNLFQSSQDTNVVSAYSIVETGGVLVASPMPTAPALTDIPNSTFYPGQYVMTFVPLAANPGITLVSQADGGLDYTSNGSAHSVRGIVISYQTLFVVDEAASQVGVFDAVHGTFSGWITTTGTGLPPMKQPVGIAANAEGTIYIGASKSSAIYQWQPQAGGLSGVLSLLVTGPELANVSGLAVLPDGSILFGSRTSAAPSGGAENYSIYRYAAGNIAPWVTGFTDTPECLLVVSMPAA